MRILQRIAPFAVIAAVALLLLYLPDMGPEGYTDLASFFRNERGRQAYTGYAVVAVKDGSVLYVDAFGKDAEGKPLGTDTPLLMGSASKSFTGLLAASLARDRSLDLDKAARDYIPGFGFAGGSGGEVKLRHLLSNTSGVSDSGFDDVHEYASSLEAAVRSLASAKPLAAPGAEFHYINTGYQALGLAMELATRRRYADLMAERVFRPLGMKDSRADPASAARLPPAGASCFFGAVLPRPRAVPAFGAPSGYLVSTASDLGNYLAFLAAPDKAKRPPISPRAAAALFQPLVPGIPYGYGWFLEGQGQDRSASHAGSLDGYSARFVVWPERRAAIAVIAPQNSLLQSLVALPALAEGARGIMLDGRAERLLPLSRIYILLAVSAMVHLLALAVQTGSALDWAKDIRGRAEATGTLGPIVLAAGGAWLGLAVRAAVAVLAPLALGWALGRAVTWKVAFAVEPGLASWLAAACAMGGLRNLARLVWLRGARRYRRPR